MPDHRSCCPTALASGPIVRVDLCPACNVVSLHLGATTLRLDAGALESLWSTLGHALTELHTRDAQSELLEACEAPVRRFQSS
jgi:hypothetical protein